MSHDHEPLPPDEHAKPVQPDTDMTVGHGDYIEDPEEQDALWAEAVTPDHPEFDHICTAACEADHGHDDGA